MRFTEEQATGHIGKPPIHQKDVDVLASVEERFEPLAKESVVVDDANVRRHGAFRKHHAKRVKVALDLSAASSRNRIRSRGGRPARTTAPGSATVSDSHRRCSR